MAAPSNELHFVLFPFFAQGHMIPMVDIAKLLARQGIIISVVTTPNNAKRFATPLSHAKENGLRILFVEVPFPSEEIGLPKGCENIDMLPSSDQSFPFMEACNLLQKPVEKLFGELKPRPNCMISDICLPYTSHIARKFGIPRISFNGFSSFCLLCLHNVRVAKVFEKLTSDSESFIVPGLPDYIEMSKNKLPGVMIENASVFSQRLFAAEKDSYGMIINTFEELEAAYVAEYKRAKQDKVWCFGPVSLCNKDNLEKINRGDKSVIDESECLRWLDSQKPGSVIYASLGTLCNLGPSQLIEFGFGLESSNKPFIWVIRGGENSKEIEKLLEEDGFQERTRGRGLLIRGWSPQVVILSHQAIGGFLTHCGWNSILEAICTGIPVITCPLFGDQFCNEKLVVEVSRIGVKVEAEGILTWGHEEELGVWVRREAVKKAIDKLVDDGEDSQEMRKRVKELSRIAEKATEEEGSSDRNVKMFIQYILQLDMATRHVSC